MAIHSLWTASKVPPQTSSTAGCAVTFARPRVRESFTMSGASRRCVTRRNGRRHARQVDYRQRNELPASRATGILGAEKACSFGGCRWRIPAGNAPDYFERGWMLVKVLLTLAALAAIMSVPAAAQSPIPENAPSTAFSPKDMHALVQARRPLRRLGQRSPRRGLLDHAILKCPWVCDIEVPPRGASDGALPHRPQDSIPACPLWR